jgi:hypothetical protein
MRFEGKQSYHRSPTYDWTFIYIFIVCVSFWVIKIFMGALRQVLEIIFEGQRIFFYKNNTKKNKLFQLTKRDFLFPFYLDPSYFQTS